MKLINLTSHDWVVRTEAGDFDVPMSKEIHDPIVLRRRTTPGIPLGSEITGLPRSNGVKPEISVVIREIDRQDIEDAACLIENLAERRTPILVSGHVFDHMISHLSKLALTYLFSPDTSPKSVIRKNGKVIGVKRIRAVPLSRRA